MLENKYIPETEVMELLGFDSAKGLRIFVNRGEIPGIKLVTGGYVYIREDINKWVEKQAIYRQPIGVAIQHPQEDIVKEAIPVISDVIDEHVIDIKPETTFADEDIQSNAQDDTQDSKETVQDDIKPEPILIKEKAFDSADMRIREAERVATAEKEKPKLQPEFHAAPEFLLYREWRSPSDVINYNHPDYKHKGIAVLNDGIVTRILTDNGGACYIKYIADGYDARGNKKMEDK